MDIDTPRVRTGHVPGEVSPNVFGDFDWVREHRQDLLAQYGECIILIYEKTVIGVGQTIREATEDAERNLPPEVGQVTPITEFLRHRHPLWRVRQSLLENEG